MADFPEDPTSNGGKRAEWCGAESFPGSETRETMSLTRRLSHETRNCSTRQQGKYNGRDKNMNHERPTTNVR